ncbi:MAG TPA: hypothetical protein VKP67_03975 [Xanthobacteraceae bacterium]|nr:hypothetical protein [Xanthobacteraceae bacterium]
MADDDPITDDFFPSSPLTSRDLPFTPPAGAVSQEPAELDFETPPQAFAFCERPEHPDLPQLLLLADVGDGITTDEHRVALEKLLTILRQQVNELRRGERRSMDAALLQFLKRVLAERGMRALASADPADAAKFLYGPRKRGKRASSTTAERDLQITREVIELIESGKTYENATADVAERRDLSRERVEKIYKHYRRQARLRNVRI